MLPSLCSLYKSWIFITYIYELSDRYVWELNPAVLELDIWADRCFVLHRRNSNSLIGYTTAPFN